MLRYLYLTVFTLLLSLMAWAGPPVKQTKAKARPKLVIKTDSTTVAIRHFAAPALQDYKNQKEFQYTDTYVGESWWTRFKRWFWNLFTIKDKKTAASVIGIVIEYLFILLGVAALIFLILKLAGIDAFNVIKRRSLTLDVPYDESVENIYAINFETDIEKAVMQKNYRFAVRLLYLKLLKQLSDADLIRWEINKTNSIYIDELTNAQQRNTFKLLTRQFEYIWYGELAIDAEAYKRINGLFTDFKIKAA